MFYQGATAAHMRSHKVPFHTPDPVSWGHMSSSDLTHWEQHPTAIAPAAPTSYEGADVYSGAMIQDPDDGNKVKAFFACGVGDAKPPGGNNDAVCYAEADDDGLINWTKYNGTHDSVVLYIPEALGAAAKDYSPEAGSQFIFRNETDGAGASNSTWVMMVGSVSNIPQKKSFAVLLFSAPSLKPTAQWTFKGPMFRGGGSGTGIRNFRCCQFLCLLLICFSMQSAFLLELFLLL